MVQMFDPMVNIYYKTHDTNIHGMFSKGLHLKNTIHNSKKKK